MGQESEIKNMINNAPEWSEYLVKHTESIRDDNAVVLHAIGNTLLQKQKPVGTLYLVMAFDGINEETYDKEKTKEM